MAITQITKILVRRGLEADLPDQLDSGELGYAIDSRKLFIGNGSVKEGAPVEGNTEILTQQSDISSQVLSYQAESTVIKNNSQGVTFARYDANEIDTFFMKYSILRGTARAMSLPVANTTDLLFKSGSKLTIAIGQASGVDEVVTIEFGGESAFADITMADAFSAIQTAIAPHGCAARLTSNNELELTAEYSPITLTKGSVIVSSESDVGTLPVIGQSHAADLTINGVAVIASNGEDSPTITTVDVANNLITFADGHGILDDDYISEKTGSTKFLASDVTFSRLSIVSPNVFKVDSGLFASPDLGAATAIVYKGSNPLPSTLDDVVSNLNKYNTTSDNNKVPGFIAARNVSDRLVMEFDADFVDLAEGMPDSPNDVLDALFLLPKRYSNALHGLGFIAGVYSTSTAVGTIEVIGDPSGKGNMNFSSNSSEQGLPGVDIYPEYNPQSETIEFKYNASDLNSSTGANVDGLINFETRRWKSDFQLLSNLQS